MDKIKLIADKLNERYTKKYGKLTLHGILLSIASVAVDIILLMKFAAMFGIVLGFFAFIGLNLLMSICIIVSNANSIMSEMPTKTDEEIADSLIANTTNSRLVFKTIFLALLHFMLHA